MVKSSSYCPSRVYIVGNGVLGVYRSKTGDPGSIGRISESYCGPAISSFRPAMDHSETNFLTPDLIAARNQTHFGPAIKAAEALFSLLLDFLFLEEEYNCF